MRFSKSNTSIFNIGYHLIWCPKYRRDVLVGAVEKRLKDLLRKKSKQISVHIEKMEIMPDHVHLFVKSLPTISAHKIVQQGLYIENIETGI